MKKQAPKQNTVRDRLFDSGWKFHRTDAPGAEQPDFDDAAWRKLDLPHDWSLEDLPPVSEESVRQSFLPVVQGTWRFKKGDNQAWKEPGLAETDWETVTLPATWEQHSNYTEDNVYGWFRRRITMPASFQGSEIVILLGKIDDVDEAFVNGVRIGGSGRFPPDFVTAFFDARAYPVPAGLLRGDGTDVLAVRVFDGPGSGGIYAAPPLPEVPARIGPFDTHASPGGKDTGYVLGGIGWYRKVFALPAADQGRQVSIRFDGVYMNSDVWINGHHVGNHPYGYTSFAYDLTPHLNPAGQPNVLSVRVRNVGRNSRWYSGSGIYRHTWLTVTDPLHIALWGICVTTPEVARNQAVVRIATTLENAAADTMATVNVRIVDAKGREVAASTAVLSVTGQGASAISTQDLVVKRPRRWSVEEPNLYRAQVEVFRDGQAVDRTENPFGIRTFSFDARTGFMLNGVTLKMKGACLHHDNGLLGAAAFDRAEERRVEIMKANGYNAIRTSHNPPSVAFLDACDRLGVLVMDESFDIWRMPKNSEDYHRFFDDWWQRDTDSMVLRDRNHPSIVIWSVGNEIPERYDADGAKSARIQADRVRELDPTRPVTSAFCGVNDQGDAYFAALDVAGYNYGPDRYVIDHQRHPSRVIVCTESFPLKAFEYWMGVLDHPHVVGDFVWTGMDYFGEAGIGFTAIEGDATGECWPYHGAPCGDIDICGGKRAPSYYRDVLWGNSKLEMAVHHPLPEGKAERVHPWGWPDEERHWTWPGREGRPMQVAVYSSAEKVRLTLNGKTIGEQAVSRATQFTARFDVPYEPGELRAVAVTGNRTVAALAFQSAGAPKKLRLTADRSRIRADRNDLAFVTVEIVDAAGRLVPQAETPVRLTVTGVGELAAAGNANLKHAASIHQPVCVPFRGRGQAILRPKGKAGRMALRAQAEGLAPATLQVTVACKK